MKLKLNLSVISLALVLTVTLAGTAQAGKIVLANDEWTLSNTGFTNAPDAGVFVGNVASWFTGGGFGTFHAISTNFGLTQGSLASAMSGAGHTYTTGTGLTVDLATLLTFDGIFLAGNAVDNTVLIDYVNAGGNVYLEGGTGAGGAVAEAAQWNTFLNAFGMAFGSPYNGVAGNIAISNSHPIFSGVGALFQNNGSDALDISVSDPRAQVLVSAGGHDLYAVFESSAAAAPEPGTLILMGSSIFGLIGWKIRKQRSA